MLKQKYMTYIGDRNTMKEMTLPVKITPKNTIHMHQHLLIKVKKKSHIGWIQEQVIVYKSGCWNSNLKLLVNV